MGMTTRELADSDPEYERYRNYDAETAFRTHLREYNRWWVDNVPYIDIPDANVKKMSYYRTFLNRYNYVDANIPGNDFQFPVSIEGVLGYNNAIQLTQPMHMQDLKYFRDPLWSYGDWVSSGETSKCTAFTDNPGNTANWNNTYEQYIAREAWQAYKVHGGNQAILENFAKYAECDIKGQLAKYDTNNNGLIAYDWGALTGNDADAVALAFYNSAPQERTETAFWYSGRARRGGGVRAARPPGQGGRDERDRRPTSGPRSSRCCGMTGRSTAAAAGRRPSAACRASSATRCASATSRSTPRCRPGWSRASTTSRSRSGSTRPRNQTWSRVFDFGTGTTQNMFLTVNAGGAGVRYAITTGGGGAEQQITYNGSLPLNQWSHLAVTLTGTTGRLYLNGAVVATNDEHDAAAVEPGGHDPELDRPLAVRRPGLNAIVDDFQILRPRAARRRRSRRSGRRAGAGNVASYRFDEDERQHRHRLLAQRAQRDAGVARVPQRGQGVQAARHHARRARAVEGPAELLALHRGRGPQHRQLQARAALLRRQGRVPDHAVLHRQPA